MFLFDPPKNIRKPKGNIGKVLKEIKNKPRISWFNDDVTDLRFD